MGAWVRSNATHDELFVVGGWSRIHDGNGEARLFDQYGHEVTPARFEHWLCVLAFGLEWTLPNRRSFSAKPAQPDKFPTKLGFVLHDDLSRQTAISILRKYVQMVQSGAWSEVSRAFHLINEYAVKSALDAEPTIDSLALFEIFGEEAASLTNISTNTDP